MFDDFPLLCHHQMIIGRLEWLRYFRFIATSHGDTSFGGRRIFQDSTGFQSGNRHIFGVWDRGSERSEPGKSPSGWWFRTCIYFFPFSWEYIINSVGNISSIQLGIYIYISSSSQLTFLCRGVDIPPTSHISMIYLFIWWVPNECFESHHSKWMWVKPQQTYGLITLR